MKNKVIRLTSFILTIIIAMSTIFYTSAFDETGQIKITEPTPLLKEDGSLTQPGYCFTELYQYDRSAIKANKTRIKEWDFSQISNSRYVMQVTMADISLGGAANVTLF